jgi:hypothetical protein
VTTTPSLSVIEASYTATSITDVRSKRLELERIRALSRAWSKTVHETRRTEAAALFVRHALEALSHAISPNIVLSAPIAKPFGQLDHAAKTLAEAFGKDAARLPLVEAIHIVTSLYPILLPCHDRSALGAYYTPLTLCSRLLDQATEAGVNWERVRVLDPAAGGGVFLIEAAQRMRAAMKNCEPAFVLRQIGTRLLGLELDPYAASLAQSALDIVLSDLALATGLPVPKIVRACDTLDEPAEEIFDLVVGKSGNKVVMRDDSIANAIGLKIEADKNRPDLILADLGPPEPLIIFVEIVATDGAITPRRQAAIYELTDAAGFARRQVAFLTAYQDRDSAGFKKTVAQLAWNTFAWFVSEPYHIVALRGGGESQCVKLSALV